MEAIIRPRQAGKTTEALRIAAEGFRHIICPTKEDVRRLWQIARQQQIDIPMPITWAEFMYGRSRGTFVRGFVIDDLDRCLQSVTPVEIQAVSMTGPVPIAEVWAPDSNGCRRARVLVDGKPYVGYLEPAAEEQ